MSNGSPSSQFFGSVPPLVVTTSSWGIESPRVVPPNFVLVGNMALSGGALGAAVKRRQRFQAKAGSKANGAKTAPMASMTHGPTAMAGTLAAETDAHSASFGLPQRLGAWLSACGALRRHVIVVALDEHATLTRNQWRALVRISLVFFVFKFG
jgi:hypothetical protein